MIFNSHGEQQNCTATSAPATGDICIPIEQYRRLINDSVELIRAKETIATLTSSLEKKTTEEEQLRAKLKKCKIYEHLSSVSHEYFTCKLSSVFKTILIQTEVYNMNSMYCFV